MGFFQKWLYGIDLEEEQRRADELERQRQEMNKGYEPGGDIYERIKQQRGAAAADDAYSQVLAQDQNQDINVEKEVDEAFWEGWDEGYENITGGVRETIRAPFTFAWDSIPWQLWAGGLVFLLYYMGGWTWLEKRFLR